MFSNLGKGSLFKLHNVDPLALVINWYLLDEAEPHQAAYLLQERSVAGAVHEPVVITDNAAKMAEDIRKYYSQKLTLEALKKPLTKFRQSLLHFLSRPIGQVDIDEIGLVVKLPQFYHEDIVLDKFDAQINQPELLLFPNLGRVSSTLTFQAKTIGSKNTVKYWFTDQDGYLCCVHDSASNQLLPAFDRVIEQPVSVKSYKSVCSIRGRDTTYYSIYKWDLQ